MKRILNKLDILAKISMLNENNAYEVLEKLADVTDEEGKTPLILALDAKMYDKFILMISKIPYRDGDVIRYRIFFDPFNRNVFENTERLNWVHTEYNFTSPKIDYQGVLNTKVNYCSSYSAYNYILNIDDKEIKERLLEACFNISYDDMVSMLVKDVVPKDNFSNVKLFEEKDVLKYVPFPLQESMFIFLEKNIPISTFGLEVKQNGKCGQAFISIKSDKVSRANKIVINQLIENGMVSYDYNCSRLVFFIGDNCTVLNVSQYFVEIANLFHKQLLVEGYDTVVSVYDYTRKILSSYGVELPVFTTKSNMIEVCTKANEYLTLSDNEEIFYYHPALKCRVEGKVKKL